MHFRQPTPTQRRPNLNDPALQGALLRMGPINIQSTLSTVAVAAVRRHPVKLSLNFLGLALLFLLPGLTPTEQQNRDYERLRPKENDRMAESQARSARDARHRDYRASVGFLWSCDAACTRRQREYEAAQAEWQVANARVEQQLIEANSALGIFSAPAVEDARDLFWGAFGRGMAMAKRMSMWDILFVGMRSMGRDEGMAQFLLDMALRVVMNVSVGIFSGVLSFLFAVYSVIKMYGGGLAGLLFFLCCALSGGAFLATSYTVIFGGLAVAGCGVFNAAVAAIEQQQEAARRLNNNERQHRD